MTAGSDRPDGGEAHAEIDQRARASDHARAYQAARDQQITEITVHYHGAPERASADLPEIMHEISAARSDFATAEETATDVQNAIVRHHSLIDLLYQMWRKAQQAVEKLTAERDDLRTELHSLMKLDADLKAIQDNLADKVRRLEQAERVQAETARRLDEAQQQRAEAERLKAEALEQLANARNRLADLEQSAPSPSADRPGARGEDDDVAIPLMGETDRWVASEILGHVDDMLRKEADNLSVLRGMITEADSRDNEAPRAAESEPWAATTKLPHLSPDIGARNGTARPPVRQVPKAVPAPRQQRANRPGPTAVPVPQQHRGNQSDTKKTEDTGVTLFVLGVFSVPQYTTCSALGAAISSNIFSAGNLGPANYIIFVTFMALFGFFPALCNFVGDDARRSVKVSANLLSWALGLTVGLYHNNLPILGNIASFFSHLLFLRP